MSANGASPLTLDELERRLKAADPAAVLLPPRLLRRVIKHDLQLPGIGLQVPHRKSYVCGRDRLLVAVDGSALGLTTASLPETLVLLPRPEPEALAGRSAESVLASYWELLFHTRVHRALEALSEETVRERVARLGAAEFEEVRAVLRHDGFLMPPGDDRTLYVEFAAVYLGLRHFHPDLVPLYFPGIHAPAEIDALLAEDIDMPALLAATRLEGAPEPVAAAADDEPAEGTPPSPPSEPAATAEGLLPRADAAAAVGNLVRAAILRTRAAAARPEQATALRAAAGANLDRLAERLQVALQLHRAEAESWKQVLPALLPPAAVGIWPVAARLLYDLQKVCMDHEKAVYALDLVEWARSLGRRPIKRPLHGQQEVLALKHLRSALKRLTAARLGDADRRQLAGLLTAAIHHSEERLRERFRPVLLGTLEEISLRPANLPERVARHKLVEELLDRVAGRGFINLSDLRDAVSRNQLKLPDLAGPGEFWFGDALLLIDRRLGEEMEGVYRRGEVYLRWLQRFSALGFGTRVGRFLTRYVALPFGGSFVILEGLQHVVEPLVKLLGARPAPAEPLPDDWQGMEAPPEVKETAHASIHLLNGYTFLLLGFFLLGLLYVPSFRRQVVQVLRTLFRGLRLLVYDAPARLVQLPAVQRLLHSQAFTLAWQFALKPLLVAVAGSFVLLEPLAVLWPTFLGLPFRPGPEVWLTTVGVLFVAANVFLNSRPGRDLEERVADEVERTWGRLLHTFLPGLFYLVLDFFKAVVEAVERLLYTVDEKLRFRTGDSRLSLYAKPVLGLVWFGVAYVVRFCVNLLIEPQVNPIKHFPVVTVSHKLVLTMGVPVIARGLAFTFDMDLKTAAIPMATLIGSLIPGIFGFLVWELKENWKLYRANRAPTLRPSVVGSHGETLPRLLRPGFHSGTVPKLFAKLRKARRRAVRRGRWRAFRKHRDALHHVEEAVLHFVERELLRLLDESKAWGDPRVQTGEVLLSTNQIRVELHCPDLGTDPVWFSFVERSGWLAARVEAPGWLPRLSEDQRRALTAALAGQYKLSGVDLLGDEMPPEEGADGGAHFGDVEVTWEQWVELWESDQAGKELPTLVPAGVRVLPDSAAEAVVQNVS